MNFIFILWISLIGVPTQGMQNNPIMNGEKSAAFTFKIYGINNKIGEVRIAMFNSEESYSRKENPIYAIVLPVDSTVINWSVNQLPKGVYAIAVYHDRNKNGKLDTNFLGIPKERYGFSNNARGKFGPASWKDAHFEVIESEVIHEVKIK